MLIILGDREPKALKKEETQVRLGGGGGSEQIKSFHGGIAGFYSEGKA